MKEYITSFLPLAQAAGEAFELNPTVILAQSIIETGWGQSVLCREHNNFFGITAYGKANAYWKGGTTTLGRPTWQVAALKFRTYETPLDSFMDYARLLRARYHEAAQASNDPETFARLIAYSRYISEVNGDDREAYRSAIVSLCHTIVNC
jgi:flagellar protein FlgJ